MLKKKTASTIQTHMKLEEHKQNKIDNFVLPQTHLMQFLACKCMLLCANKFILLCCPSLERCNFFTCSYFPGPVKIQLQIYYCLFLYCQIYVLGILWLQVQRVKCCYYVVLEYRDYLLTIPFPRLKVNYRILHTHPPGYTSGTFLFVCLFGDVSFHIKHKTRCQGKLNCPYKAS